MFRQVNNNRVVFVQFERPAYAVWIGLLLMASCSHTHRSPHASEIEKAKRIDDLGGTYALDINHGRHIVGVWLTGTEVSAHDISAILELQFLRTLGVNDGTLSDDSLRKIFGHTGIVELDVQGTIVNRELLLELASTRDIFLVDDSTAEKQAIVTDKCALKCGPSPTPE